MKNENIPQKDPAASGVKKWKNIRWHSSGTVVAQFT
jgi:hypothetical protein